ncbi:ABC transporter ATP-binding protein [bacterium]|nr:ABC transporter ATP-binding protein [bacterium]MBU1651205.1 ABC transporter ATP-binding protein [bacterium]MBU1881166.1 ABC transporter ATP-binding protein [bacterium]
MNQEVEKSIVRFEAVSFSYHGQTVLENVTFTVDKQQMTYVVGPNGGGKTTLLKLIMGLLQPDSGTVRIFGKPPEKVRTRIGYAPQHLRFDPKFPVTVLDVVMMGRLQSGFFNRPSSSDKKAALAALDELGVADLARKAFSDLSGGQRQRILIARSLGDNPDLLLLDEPTANVDAHTGDKLLKTIRDLSERMTILMVSHDLGFVTDNVRSVICVNRRVHLHPTENVTSDSIRKLYDQEMRIIRHDITH